MSSHVCLGLEDAARHGIEKCVEKMLSFTQQLRRLKVDQYEYVSMKLICLLTSGMTPEITKQQKHFLIVLKFNNRCRFIEYAKSKCRKL